MERKIHIEEGVVVLHIHLCTVGNVLDVGIYGIACHMQVACGNDDEIELIYRFSGCGEVHIFGKVALAAKVKADAVGLGEWERLGYTIPVMLAAPVAGTGHVLVPEVVGEAYMLKAVCLGVVKYVFGRLLGVI